MSADELIFLVIVASVIAIEVFGGVICWLCAREVDQCHR